ncbi:MAG: DUF429 domain-containing protein [Candidatus Nezhaarchaeota archaeon]|nr:DUF429 domain-containing protein [Candidatus Nezhaarchaeota archaeon]MCX8142422.1 DUF429 domain-containing protein [Candidatus Nezhaarchaeota archaeon]MDW8050605.1 DUF429 domain-containing protein [Nitrososphaerota archaeon]
MSVCFLGLDLAALSTRPTGYCVLYLDMCCDVGIVFSDDDILRLAVSVKPKVIAIDSPLSLAIDGGALRKCDLEARKRGYMVLPLSMPNMAKLTVRGMKLRDRLSALGFEVIEVFPTGAFKVLGLTPPKRNFKEALNGLRRLGLRLNKAETVHELDAAISAYVAYKYVKSEVEVLGDPREGVIIMPML